MMSTLMSDLIEGSITPQVGNAVVHAGSRLLRLTELKYKYGNSNGTAKSHERTLQLVSGGKLK